MRARALCLLSFIAAVAAAPSSARAGAWALSPGEYYSEFKAGRFFADTYYGDDAVRRVTTDVAEQRALTITNEFGWKKSLSWVLAAPVSSRTLRLGNFEQTQTGLGDLDLALKYRLRAGGTAAVMQFGWSAPLGYDAGSVPALGDGLQTLAGSLHVGHPLASLGFVELSGGWAQRFRGPMSGQKPLLIPGHVRGSAGQDSAVIIRNPDYDALAYQAQLRWSADAGVWVGSSLLLTGHYLGFNTQSHGDAARDDATQIIGPEVRYRVDDRLDVILGSNHSASGRNIRHLDEYYVGVAFRHTKLNRLQGLLGSKTLP